MPEYAFLNLQSKKLEMHTMSASKYDVFKKNNPHLERYIESAPAVSFAGKIFTSFDSKTDNTWKEVLAKVAEAHPASNLADQYGKKTIKGVKTRNIMAKHADKVMKREQKKK